MPLSRLFRKFSQSNLARPGSADGERDSEHSDDSPQQLTEPVPTTPRSWRKKSAASTANRSTSSSPMSTLPFTKSPAPEVGALEQPMPMPLPSAPDIFVTNLALMPHPETMPPTSPVPDNLAEAWDVVKDGPKDSDKSRSLNTVGKSET
jgi:hypothetical protein